MLAPLLITGGVLGALYATRGMPATVRPGKRYLLGFPQLGVERPATETEIESARSFIEQGNLFRNATFAKTTVEDGQRIYWFKATSSGPERAVSRATQIRIYETIL